MPKVNYLIMISILVTCSSSPPDSFNRLELPAVHTFTSKSSLGVGDVIEVRVYEEK